MDAVQHRVELGEPAAMPMLEFEALVKVFFAEHGSKEQLLETLGRILAAAERARTSTPAGPPTTWPPRGGSLAGRR